MEITPGKEHESEGNDRGDRREDYVKVTGDSLRLEELMAWVASPSAGAISTFSGVTRDNFNGRRVVRLEYEAYVPMAEREMVKIVVAIRKRWQVVRVAIVHRIGVVPVSEASVIIAISSKHRDEGLAALRFAIDEVKAVVPIWKKEFYADEGQQWKENAECFFLHNSSPGGM